MEQGDYANNFPTTKAKWQARVEEQDNELMAWIDEFIESEEYSELLQSNLQNSAHNTTKQPFSNSLHRKKKPDNEIKPRGHTEDLGKHTISLFEEKIQGSLLKLKIKDTVTNQRLGIEIIRQKILEAKQQYHTNILSSIEHEYENKMNTMSILRDDYKLSLDSAEITSNIVRRLRKIRKTRKSLTEKRKLQVVSNILRDMRRDQKEKRLKTKVIKVRKKKVTKVSTVDVTELLPTNTQSDFTEYEATHKLDISLETALEEAEALEEVVFSAKSPTSGKKSAKTPKEKKRPKPKADKKSNGKSSKSTEIPATPVVEDVIPAAIPNPNPRKKVVPEYVLTELLENITKLYNYLKDKELHELQNELTSDILLPYDDGFFSKPDKIIFKDYEPGKKYKKVISIVNGNQIVKKINLDRVIWNTDVEEDYLLNVEPFGTRRVSPGMSFTIWMRFSPQVINKTIDGKIIFITYTESNSRAHQFLLRVVGVPRCAAVLITPTVVSFEEMPIWRLRSIQKEGKNYKTITITNSGLKECKVVITKIFNNHTMEQEWKKIISIIRIDDLGDSEKKQLSSSNLEDPSLADPFPRNLVQQCVENVFNAFKFDRNVFNVMPQSTMTLKCWLRDISEPGYQVESYNFSIYERFADGQLYSIGSQVIIVNSETTPHFLTSSVEILDFEVCVYGSGYQLDFDLTNPCKLAHHVRICFPFRMKEYLQANPSVTTILPNQTVKIWIKFFPKSGILKDNKFYDSEVCLLDFPIYVTVQTKGYEDTPPLRIDVFAAATQAQGVVLRLISEPICVYEDGNYSYDMGNCTTVETISFDVCVRNTSLVPQQFGFLSLPSFVSLTPNCGFGILKPMEQASVQVLISPGKQDITNPSGLVKFRLVVNTIKHRGGLRKRSNERDLVKRLKEMEDFVCKSQGSTSSKLKEDMYALSEAFKNGPVNIISPCKSSSQSVERFMNAMDNEQLINLVKYDMEEEKEISSNMEEITDGSRMSNIPNNILSFRFNVIEVVVEFSHQIVCFPSTPCGSYSLMSIDLILHSEKNKVKKATFEIYGGVHGFEVQPSVGKLSKKKKIWIISRPKLPEYVVKEKALAMRRLAAEEAVRLKAEEAPVEEPDVPEKTSKKGAKKAKPKKAPKTKKQQKEEAPIDAIDPAIISRDELYQAEMNAWRCIEPYTVETLYKCRVNFNNSRPEEEISFRASCLVVPPDFIHDQSYQVIDFGSVIIGTSSTKTIKFKNIQRKSIVIEVSVLNPVGPFSTRSDFKPKIPSEYIYSYSITFTPRKEQAVGIKKRVGQKEIEYLDVVSNNTSYPFIIRGVGIQPQLVFNPNFTVYRLTATKMDFIDFTFDVKNESMVAIKLRLEQVCELEGTIFQLEATQSGKKSPKGGKGSKTSKFSMELTTDEVNALENTFALRDESPVFKVIEVDEEDNSYTMEPNTKRRITVRFMYNKGSSNKETLTFLAKYNIYVGQNFIKDIILVAAVA